MNTPHIKVQNRCVDFCDLGLMEYSAAFDLQQKLMGHLIQLKLQQRDTEPTLTTPNYLLFVEHPHVYTMGKSGHMEHLLANEEFLNKIGAEFVQTNRGGDITYHGYGQLVAYPILNLDNFSSDIFLYLRNLEEVIIRLLADYGLKGQRSEGETGVWLDVGTPAARKICAMGVKTSKWVTMHGLALNINTDLQYFDYIVPCGIRGKAVTSLQQEIGREFSVAETEEVKALLLRYFCEVFEADLGKLDL